MAVMAIMDKLAVSIFFRDMAKISNNNIQDKTFPGRIIRETLMGKDIRTVKIFKEEFQTFLDNLFQILIFRDKIFPGRDLMPNKVTTANILATMLMVKGILARCTTGKTALEPMGTLTKVTRA
jgi:hypothetical protein